MSESDALGLRVVHILGELRPSGAEVMLDCTYPLWLEVGVTPSILAWGERAGAYAEALAASGYDIAHVPRGRTLTSLMRLVWCTRELRPNVVHLHTEQMSFWVLLALRLALPRTKLVRTIHNTFPFAGWLRLRRLAQRQIVRRLGVVQVAISPSVQANEAARFRLRCPLIWNWVDVAAFSGVANGPQRHLDGQIVMIGNCAPWKRHDLGLRAFAQMDRTRRRLVHAGMEEAARPERALAEDLGILGRVDFLGPVRVVPDVLANAALLLMPSEREGLPLVVGEALVAGVPIVATDVPGIRDYSWSPLLRLFEATPEALAGGMQHLLDDPPEEGERIAASLEAQARLSPRRGVDEYTALYRRPNSKRRTEPR